MNDRSGTVFGVSVSVNIKKREMKSCQTGLDWDKKSAQVF